MVNNFFKGPFKQQLYSYYLYKINLGYKFESEREKLINFDNYTNINNSKDLSMDLIYNYINSKQIKQSSKSSIISVLRGFVKYLLNKNECNFIIPNKIYKRNEKKVPHIFTDSEINNFFATTESFYPNDELKNIEINLCFKLLYCTGMRISECLNIRYNDIDFNNNSINIYKTKNNIDRRIIVNDYIIDIIKKLKEISIKEVVGNSDEYLFIKRDGSIYKGDDMYAIFRKILYYAGIEHNENGPRLHDFRHTFCVRSYQKIINNGGDYFNQIAALSAYVGHKKFTSTEYYLRLTADLYPNIRNKIEEYSNSVIADIKDYDE